MTLQAKFAALAAGLSGEFFEREEIVNGLINAALAGEHVLLLGPKGAAKSALVNALTRAVTDAVHFEWLLSKFTNPEELMGPISFKGLEKDRYARVTTGKLPEAHIAFLDETFKANSPILNSLLALLNERKFYNDGKPIQVPLRMVVGASNELPDGPELDALFDRFLVRFDVPYLSGTENWLNVVQGNFTPNAATITVAEWDAARAEVLQVKFSRAMAELLFKLREELRKDLSVQLSDRRWRQCVKLLQAAAWRAGESEVQEEMIPALAPALWEDRAHIAAVRDKCTALAGSTVSECQKVVAEVADLVAALPTVEGRATKEQSDQFVVCQRESQRALAKLRALGDQARTDRAKKLVQDSIAEVEKLMAPVRRSVREMLSL